MTTTTRPVDEPLGPKEVAVLLGVEDTTVRQWAWRGTTPDPQFTVSGVEGWYRSTILEWAATTGRLDPSKGAWRELDDDALAVLAATGENADTAVTAVISARSGTAKRFDVDGRRLCGVPDCPEPHRARNRCRHHYHEATGK